MTYDPFTGSLLSVVADTAGLKATTRYTYNGAGLVTFVTDPVGYGHRRLRRLHCSHPYIVSPPNRTLGVAPPGAPKVARICPSPDLECGG
jgi:YD repeat-containing protein